MTARNSYRNRHFTLALAALVLFVLSCALLQPDLLSGQDTPTPDSPRTSSQETQGVNPTSAGEQPTTDLSAAKGECSNALLPLQEGNQWKYEQRPAQTTEGTPEASPSPQFTYTWTVTQVDQSQATIGFESETLPISSEYTVDCEDGAILTFPTMALSISLPGGRGGTADISYSHSQGVFLPSVEQFEENNWDLDWDTEIVITGQITSSPSPDQSFEVVLEETPWNMSWSTAGEGEAALEPVTVPASEFEEALKVNQESAIEMTLEIQGAEFSTAFNSVSGHWYVEGVGLVRQATSDSGFEMSGLSLPIPISETDSVLQLVSFGRADP